MSEQSAYWVVTGTDGVTRTLPMPGPESSADRDKVRKRRPRWRRAQPQDLRDIEGPSAFGGSPKRFFDLLRLTSMQQYRLQYRTSLLGYVWAVLRPLSLFAVLYFVFSQVIRYGDSIPNFALILLLGIMLYQFFADATGTALSALVRGEPVVRKMHFPRIVIPLSVVVSAAMTAAVNLGVTLGFVVVFGAGFQWTWFLMPLLFVVLAALTAGVAILLSVMFVSIRDVGQIWNVITRVLFYASPILYPLERVPEQFQSIVALNPLAPIIAQARIWVIDPSAPGVIETVGLPTFLGSVAIGVAICGLGLWLFVRQAPRVAELL
ncbi:MAG TPA: ABC transporter permease [Solirubrobacterales bacterium]|nr:ABC transporter permease [Solirubrobacterales bacterium]